MPMREFLDRVKAHFGYLFDDYGFTIEIQECYKMFGNCLVILRAGDCRIAIEKDRSQILVDIVSPLSREEKFPLTSIVGFITRLDSKPYDPSEGGRELYSEIIGEAEQWVRLGSLLKQHCQAILKLFQRDVFEQEQELLREYIRRVTREYVQRIAGCPKPGGGMSAGSALG